MNLPYKVSMVRGQGQPPRVIHAPNLPRWNERGIEASVSVFVTMLEAKVPAPIYLLNVTWKYTERQGCQLWFFKLGEMRKKKMTTWNQLEKLVGFCMFSWYPGNCRSRLVFNLHLDKSRAKENNKPLKAECKQICEQTGALLHPVDDISTYVEVFWLQYCGRGCDNLHQKQKM